MACVAYYVLKQSSNRFARVREVLVYLQAGAAAVEIRFAVLVSGVECGVVQCWLWLKLCCPLVEQLFRRGVGVVDVVNNFALLALIFKIG